VHRGGELVPGVAHLGVQAAQVGEELGGDLAAAISGWMSRTTSPAVTSRWASRFPSPVAPSTAQVRSGHGRDATIDWKALSDRIGHSDVAFTMRQYVQNDLEADRQVATVLATLILGGSLASVDITGETTAPGRAEAG
jgi:hypothetical protein